jgi:hypothetical protein
MIEDSSVPGLPQVPEDQEDDVKSHFVRKRSTDSYIPRIIHMGCCIYEAHMNATRYTRVSTIDFFHMDVPLPIELCSRDDSMTQRYTVIAPSVLVARLLFQVQWNSEMRSPSLH